MCQPGGMTGSTIGYRVFNIVAYLGFLTLLILGSVGVYNNETTTADVSNRYLTPLTPASYTFAIWFVIMVLLGFFQIYQFWISDAEQAAIGPWLGLALLCSGFWTLAWSYEVFWLCVFLAITAVFFLALVRWSGVYGYRFVPLAVKVTNGRLCCCNDCYPEYDGESLRSEMDTYTEESDKWWMHFARVLCLEMPFVIYTAWSVIAALLTILVTATYAGSPISEATSIFLVIFVFALTVVDLFLASNVWFSFTFLWAGIGIFVAQETMNESIAITALVLSILAAVLGLIVFIFRIVYFCTYEPNRNTKNGRKAANRNVQYV